VDLRIFTEPQQGAGYDDLLRVAQAAEEAGYDAFFRSDHFLAMGDASGEPGQTDAWATLAGLAQETSRIRLGTLVSSATFRLPGPLAVAVAQVDQMSGGRVELGLGSGWFEAEHAAYGIPFPALGERFSFDGRHYTVTDSPALPKPVQQPAPPVVIGGRGKKRKLAARFASEFNVPFSDVDAAAEQFGRVDAACAGVGRDPLIRSVAQVICVGRDDAEVARRALTLGREVDELRENGLTGTPDEVVDRTGPAGSIVPATTARTRREGRPSPRR
jgi:alkanesulfonate monooxygenase